MATSFDVLLNRFFVRIEEDRDFFRYFELSDEEALRLAEHRAKNYLRDAVDRFMMDGMPDIDLSNTDFSTDSFEVELTGREIYLLASLMYEFYLAKDIAKIKTYNVNFTHTDLKVFDPSNARSTFKELYDMVVARNNLLLDQYRNTDRLTGTFKTIDFAAYVEEEA